MWRTRASCKARASCAIANTHTHTRARAHAHTHTHCPALSRAPVQLDACKTLKRLVIFLLLAAACGRTGEVLTLSWETLRWCTLLNAPTFTWNSSKTRKDRAIVFFNATDRYTCPIYALANYFILGGFNTAQSADAESYNSWLFPTLHAKSDANKTMNDWLKALLPDSDVVMYKPYQVAGLPLDATCSGWRVGASMRARRESTYMQRTRIRAPVSHIGTTTRPLTASPRTPHWIAAGAANWLAKSMPSEMVAAMTGHVFRESSTWGA